MPKELRNITENIMNQINRDKLKMRPKVYFMLGSILTFIGLVATVIISTFSVGLVSFSLRSHGPMSSYKFDQILSSFPWWTLIVAIIGLALGIWLISKYDFSYKMKPWLVILGFILAIIVAGYIIDFIGLNDILSRRGPMRGMMHNYIQENNIQGPLFLNRK